MKIDDLERQLCRSLCGEIRLGERDDGYVQVDTPFLFDDGDHFTLYLKPLPTGGMRITDRGTTFMHLSYLNDLDKLREGARGRLLSQILSSSDVHEESGSLFIDVAGDQLGAGLIRFGQAMTKLHDLTFLNRARVESTFYEDLREQLRRIVGDEHLRSDFVVEGLPTADDYPVDYMIDGSAGPLYVFGVPNRDKARLATIIIQHLRRYRGGVDGHFESMAVFQNMSDIPRSDVSRLTNATDLSIDSLDAHEDLARKVQRAMSRGAANVPEVTGARTA